MAQSTNDVFPTATRVALRDLWDEAGGLTIVLPGVPGEMTAIFEAILPRIQTRSLPGVAEMEGEG